MESDQKPLRGLVLCCTSVPPEERSAMGGVAEQMGAVHKLDLTSDVTHLLVGSIDTPKYKYVAKERQDIKVVSPEWLEAVRQSWLEGGNTDVAALEEQYRLPTFSGLQICLTGFDDLDRRTQLSDALTENGADYHGDLTKAVTHLIAAAPSGKKYEYAGQWGIKIVSLEWFEQSMTRRMALEESLFHPLIPIEERGRGAVTRKKSVSPARKRPRPSGDSSDGVELGSRKLRRTASSKLQSQHDDMWSGLTTDELPRPHSPDSEWHERPQGEIQQRPNRNEHLPNITAAAAEVSHPTERALTRKPEQIFSSCGPIQAWYVYGFDPRKTKVLRKYLSANGAVLLGMDEFLGEVESDEAKHIGVIVPHEISSSAINDLISDAQLRAFTLVTDWWVEKCLHSKEAVEPKTVLYQPFKSFPIKGFQGLVICPSSFSGIDLLHFSGIVKLMGASYDETLRATTSVLICNGTSLNPEKLRYAFQHSIPVVTPEWLWACVQSERLLSFQDFLLAGSAGISQPIHTGRASSQTDRGEKSKSRSMRKQVNCLEMHPSSKSDRLQKADRSSVGLQQISSKRCSPSRQPLQDLSSNSPKKSSAPGSQSRISDDAENRIRGDSLESNGDKTVSESTAQEFSVFERTTALTNALEHLRAQRERFAANSATSQNSDPATPQHRRHRPLGRASSNPASFGNFRQDLTSFQNFGKQIVEYEGNLSQLNACDEVMPPQPSQALTYDDVESQAHRAKLLQRMSRSEFGNDGAFDATSGATTMKRVESIGVVKDASYGRVDGRSGTRRGMRKRRQQEMEDDFA